MVCVNCHYDLTRSSLGGTFLLLIDVYNYQACKLGTYPHSWTTHWQMSKAFIYFERYRRKKIAPKVTMLEASTKHLK